jgi:type IV secretory pathway TraG/TraD family ATPase VirD4
MDNLFTSVFLAQIIFFVLAALAFIISWNRSKYEASIIMVFSIAGVITGLYQFADSIHTLFEKFFFIRKFIWILSDVFPSLFMTWQDISSWVSFAFGAVIAWTMLIITWVLDENPTVVRGTTLHSKNKVQRLLNKKGKPDKPVKIGKYFFPQEIETRALSLFGEPGSGKTQIILNMLKSVSERSDRVITLDAGGDLYKRLGKKSDLLLSPVHQGSLDWSPFSEIKQESDCNMIAEAFIPNGNGESKTWNLYARNLLVVILKNCFALGKTSNRDLMYFVSVAAKEELLALVKGTSSQRLFEDGNEKMLGSVQSILGQNLSCFEVLNPDSDESSFSLRDWINDESCNSWLWLTYDDISGPATSLLRAVWVDISVKQSLSLKPNPKRRIWFVIDELASNGKIDILSKAVSRGRKYGLSIVMGVQNISQLYSLYGRDEATSILGSAGNCVILRTPDPSTSKYLSDMIGQSEIESEQVSVNNANNSTTTQKVTNLKSAILPSQISALEDLNGYIKFAGIGWTEIMVPLSKLKERNALKLKTTGKDTLSANLPITRKNVLNSTLDEI